jgi:predicted nucleotidyltransferase
MRKGEGNAISQESREAKLRRFGVRMLVLFGSAATGVRKPEDVDVAVFLTEAAKRRVRASFTSEFAITKAVADFLEQAVDDVDTVFVSPTTSPLLAYHVARDGKLLFGDEKECMRFRLLAVRRYQDAWKFQEATRQYLKAVYAR